MKKVIRKLLLKLLWYPRVFLARLGVKRNYKIGKTCIELDYIHLLPDYQSAHPLYDRFLPHFVKYIPSDSLVVDVGANVGDTLAGMVCSNSKLEYVCIEADQNVFVDLQKNVRSLQSQFPSSKIQLTNNFVGKDINNVSLEGQGGTKHAVLGGGNIQSQKLGQILKNIGVKANIALLKTDVDGFDYDVIRSSYDLLSESPYLYFEADYDNHTQLNGYKSLFSELKEKGYDYFSLFDNFGQFIVTTNDLHQLDELLDYVYRQNLKQGTRTFFYYDILSYPKKKRKNVDALIGDYISIGRGDY
jgi:FkbM family methyltransferase